MEIEYNNKANKDSSKGWIQRLKEESWEAELLVSAIAIFGTFQMFDIVSWATNFFINVLNPNQYKVGYFIVTFGLLAISILTAMFVIHFVLRAYWIGLVGLNSVFPDYSIEDSAYSKIYTKKLLSILPKLKDSIHKVDELCSVVFSVAFTFLFIYGYMAVFISIFLLVFNLLSDYVHHYILLFPVILFVILLSVQMVITIFANLKANKEKEKLQTVNFKITKFTNMIMLGPLYKSFLQITMIFGSNFKKKKSLVYLILTFIFGGFLMLVIQLPKTNILYLAAKKNYYNSTKIYSSFYKDDNKNNTFLLTPEIDSDKVDTDVIKIFIPVFYHEENFREETCDSFENDSEKPLEIQREAKTNFLLNCIEKHYKVYIDDQEVDVSYLRQNAHSRTNQKGVVSYLDITNLEKGLHVITFKKEYKNTEHLKWKIPFYKVK